MDEIIKGILVLCVILCGLSIMFTQGKDPAYFLRPIGRKLWGMLVWLCRTVAGGSFTLASKSWKKAKVPDRHLAASIFFYLFSALFYTTGLVTAIPFGSDGKKKK